MNDIEMNNGDSYSVNDSINDSGNEINNIKLENNIENNKINNNKSFINWILCYFNIGFM